MWTPLPTVRHRTRDTVTYRDTLRHSLTIRFDAPPGADDYIGSLNDLPRDPMIGA